MLINLDNLKLEKPIVFFDLETTGLKTDTDRIVQIGMIKIYPDGIQKYYKQLVNPIIPIAKEASEVHGYTNEDLKDKPTFYDVADEILNFIGDSDLAGFNSNHFDIPLLLNEFIRVGKKLNMSIRDTIDVSLIYRAMNRRRLVDAYKQYTGKELDDAHDAMVDIKATAVVLNKMLEVHSDKLKPTIKGLKEFDKSVGYDNKLIYGPDNTILLNFGKYKGKPVLVLKDDFSYYQWIMGTDIDSNTKEIIKNILNGK